MCYVYGVTLLTTIDDVSMSMSEAGLEPMMGFDGKVAYSLNALATPIAKALRKGVVSNVPEADVMMHYLQKVVRANKVNCMRWRNPVGVPVVNWSEGQVVKTVRINSMGLTAIRFAYNDGIYNTQSAANGVVPNFVHSMDSAHLCLTINDFEGTILPIHDSFATHPSDVGEMHKSIRRTFLNMYKGYSLEKEFLNFNNVDLDVLVPPPQGQLNLDDIHDAPFMFG